MRYGLVFKTVAAWMILLSIQQALGGSGALAAPAPRCQNISTQSLSPTELEQLIAKNESAYDTRMMIGMTAQMAPAVLGLPIGIGLAVAATTVTILGLPAVALVAFAGFGAIIVGEGIKASALESKDLADCLKKHRTNVNVAEVRTPGISERRLRKAETRPVTAAPQNDMAQLSLP